MDIRRKWILVGMTLLLVIAAMFVIHSDGQRPEGWTASARTTPAPSVRGDDDSLRYPAHAPQLAMIESQVLHASPVPLTDVLSARIAYDEDVTARIGVSLSGRLVGLRASAGDAVRSGQVLAEIDSPDYGSALADEAKAVADELRKRLVVERAHDLAPGEAMAAKDVEAAEADYAEARAETARAQQRVANLNPGHLPVHGQRVALTSPIGGVVTERNATPALEVGPGLAAPLFVVTDPRRLWLMIDLPEKWLSRVKLGSAVAVESDAWPQQRFEARVVQLGQVVDPNTRRVVVRARLANPAAELLPEMFVRASILQENGTGVRVPNSALVNRGVHDFVFVETAAGTFRRQQVELVARGNDFSVVGAGLHDGDRVVTTGALLLDAEVDVRTSGGT